MRQYFTFFFFLPICFNPRICKRCDNVLPEDIDIINVSIHASVKDATTGADVVVSCVTVSIHASVKDATPCL